MFHGPWRCWRFVRLAEPFLHAALGTDIIEASQLGILMTKFKLSDTMQFLTGRLNAITGGDVVLTVDIEAESVRAGHELRASARLRSPGKSRDIEYILISLVGQVQREGKWTDYVQTAEVAQATKLPADHEFVIPIVIMIPGDSVLTEDGAHWAIQARAFVDATLNPRDEKSFTVTA